jgi:putative aldouronate transport system permease protein
MLLPGVILEILFHNLPMFGIIIAFKNINYRKGILRSEGVGFKNFEFFLKTPDAFNITKNTVLYNLTFIFLGLIIAVSCALILNEITNVKLKKFYQTSMLLPYFLSWMVVSYLVYSFLSYDYGFMNRVALKLFGQEGIIWYTNLKVWPYILVFLHMWKVTGYNCVIYFAAIAGIDPELYEACEIDGASRWQKIWNITIPFLKPIMIIMTTLAVGKIFNADFGLFYQTTLRLGNGILKPVTNVIDTYVFDALINMSEVGMASAASLYQSVVGFITIMAANLIVRKIDKESSLF